jgi:hypothetical protein
MNRKRYIVVYRRRISHGKLSDALDGPINAEEAIRWTEEYLEYLRKFNSNERSGVDSNNQRDSSMSGNKQGR